MIETLSTQIIELPEYEKPFRETSCGWLGSDNAFSLPISGNRVLWLFGDTFIQRTQSSERSRENAEIINSSIAIQRGNLVKDEEALTFFWNGEKGLARSFFVNEARPGFLWPFSALPLADKLFVGAVRIIHPNPSSALGFIQTGNEIFCIENPDENPDQWRMCVAELPYQNHHISYGSHFLREKKYLYIYGYSREKETWTTAIHLEIARLDLNRTKDLTDIKYWEYLNGKTGTWSPDPAHAKPVLRQSRTEFSVTYMPWLKKYVFVANHWEYPNPITIRLSDTPFGPFSAAKIVYECPEPDYNKDYFCYAAKAHPELSEGENDLVITYMTNAKHLEDCIADKRIYYPRFLRLLISG